MQGPPSRHNVGALSRNPPIRGQYCRPGDRGRSSRAHCAKTSGSHLLHSVIISFSLPFAGPFLFHSSPIVYLHISSFSN